MFVYVSVIRGSNTENMADAVNWLLLKFTYKTCKSLLALLSGGITSAHSKCMRELYIQFLTNLCVCWLNVKVTSCRQVVKSTNSRFVPLIEGVGSNPTTIKIHLQCNPAFYFPKKQLKSPPKRKDTLFSSRVHKKGGVRHTYH